jgi:4-amino-4-deoxy-L-arabinose transferase-like glycosyltransferase
MDASEKRNRLALGLLLLLSFGLNAWAIDWGLPSPTGWAPDELLPSAVLEGMSRHFSGGWHDKYPPLHYYLLSVLYAPVLKAEGLSTGKPLPPETDHRLFLIGRGVSLLMAAGTLLLVYRCGREAGDRRAGLLAAVITALMAPFVYYAKLANLEVPYLFWWALSLLLLLKVLDRHRRRDYLLLAATAVLAVTTKDQAYGLYVLTVPLVAWARYHHDRREHGTAPRGPWVQWARPASALLNADTLLAGAVAAALFLAIHNVAGDPDGFRAHVALITGRASRDFREFSNDVGGHAALLGSTLRQLAFTLGPPGFVLGLLGLLETARRREGRWLVLLVPAVSFYVCFLSVVLYVYDRFALPLAVVAALFGGRWLSQSWNARGWVRAAARGAAAITIAYGITRAVGLDLSMTNDARYAAEDWLRANAGGGLVGTLGPAEYLPRLLGLNARPIGPAIARIEQLKPAYVAVNADYAARADDGSREQALYKGLEAGTLGYKEAWRYRYHPPWPLLDTALLVERTGREALRTNLGKVNPEVVVYGRDN